MHHPRTSRKQSRIEYPRIKQLMPTDPQIAHGHPLRSVLNRHIPIPSHRIPNPSPQPPTRQHPLRGIRPQDARPDRRTHHRLRMIEQKRIRRLPQRDAHRTSHRRPDWREMPARGLTIITITLVVIAVGGQRCRILHNGREISQRGRSRRVPRCRPQRPFPERQQRFSLRHTRSPGHGAQRARIESGVQFSELRGRFVGREQVGKCRRREGCECEGEEVGEGFW